MRGAKYIAGMGLLAALAVGCQRNMNTRVDAEAIRDMETKWNQDYAARDVDRIASHYTDDAVLLAPGMAPSVGIHEIRKLLAAMIADPALSLKFSAARIDVAGSGDLAYSQGSYLMTMTDPRTNRVVHDHGSYVTTYRHEADGTWRAVTDIATSETGQPTVDTSFRSE